MGAAGAVTVAVIEDITLVADSVRHALSLADAVRVVDADEQPRVLVLGQAPRGWIAPRGPVYVHIDADERLETLVRRVQRAARSDAAPSPEPPPRSPRSTLTDREWRTLLAVGSGASAAEIAAELGVGVRTVERDKQAIMRKLGVQSLSQAVAGYVGSTGSP